MENNEVMSRIDQEYCPQTKVLPNESGRALAFSGNPGRCFIR